MFEFPDAKRIRRDELYEPGSEDDFGQEEQLETELRDRLNAQLSGLLGLDFGLNGETSAPKDPTPQPKEAGDVKDKTAAVEPEEVAFEFRLFSNEGPTHTVVLQQDDQEGDAVREGGFIIPRRPKSYYLAEEPDPESADRFRLAAVTAEYILEDAKRRRWGLEKPWKVTHLSVSCDKTQANQAQPPSGAASASDGARKRPGKRRRIVLRTRETAKREKEEAAKRQLVDKEEHLKDKKKRLNRLKKLRRRAKERDKKGPAKDGATSEQDSDESTSE